MNPTHIYFLHEIGGKKNQEDFIWPAPATATEHDKVFIVCDGVGGAENGEIASRIISESLGNAIMKLEKPEMSVAIVTELITEAKQKLSLFAQRNLLNIDMATTLTLLVLSDKKAFIAWCGDSRIYHLRDGDILYKTSDHSLVNSLVKSGEISEEDAILHPQRNVILRAISAGDSQVEVDFHLINDVQDGDYLMLCTDGLLENITDKDLKFLLTQNDKGNIDLVEAFQQFCFGKTKDNYSMYLMRVSLKQKSASNIKKKLLLFLLLVVVVGFSGYMFSPFVKNYKKRKENNSSAKSYDSSRLTNGDSIAKIGSGGVVPDFAAANPKNSPPVTLKPLDTTSKKVNKPKKNIESPTLIIIDNSGDSDQVYDSPVSSKARSLLNQKNKKDKLLPLSKDSF